MKDVSSNLVVRDGSAGYRFDFSVVVLMLFLGLFLQGKVLVEAVVFFCRIEVSIMASIFYKYSRFSQKPKAPLGLQPVGFFLFLSKESAPHNWPSAPKDEQIAHFWF